MLISDTSLSIINFFLSHHFDLNMHLLRKAKIFNKTSQPLTEDVILSQEFS